MQSLEWQWAHILRKQLKGKYELLLPAKISFFFMKYELLPAGSSEIKNKLRLGF